MAPRANFEACGKWDMCPIRLRLCWLGRGRRELYCFFGVEALGGIRTLTMFTFLKVLAAAAIVVVLWLAIVGVPSTQQQEPTPKPPEPIPAPTTTGSALTVPAAPTTPDIAKLNDAIAKLTAAVDRLNQQLVARDPPATKPNANLSPPVDTPRRQEIYARQRRSSWRDAPCWW
jgi:hypothetical protein